MGPVKLENISFASFISDFVFTPLNPSFFIFYCKDTKRSKGRKVYELIRENGNPVCKIVNDRISILYIC